jgi:hypothetical protein
MESPRYSALRSFHQIGIHAYGVCGADLESFTSPPDTARRGPGCGPRTDTNFNLGPMRQRRRGLSPSPAPRLRGTTPDALLDLN